MGSDSKTNGSGGSGGGGGQIPAAVKNVVQNLKEIVNNNCTDSEIYAVLRDCNMDPNDAVQRLLSQDTFHEVKSRRERRKEMKETQEETARANNGTSNRGVRGGIEHSLEWSGLIQIGSYDLGKAVYRKENGSVASIPYSASSTLRATGQTWNEQPSPQSNSFNADNRRQSIGTGDMIDSSLQPSTGSQSTWVGASLGHVTMADIVRMGRSQGKGSQGARETSYTPQDAVPPNSVIDQMKPSVATSALQFGPQQDLHSSNLNMTSESGRKSSQHDFDNEWPVNDLITASNDIGATMYPNQLYIHSNMALSSNSWSDNILASESSSSRENLRSGHATSARASDKQIFMNDSGVTSEHDDNLCKDASSPDSYHQIYEPEEEIGSVSNISTPNPTVSLSDDAIKAVSSAAVNLQQLSLGEERAVTPTEDDHRVVLPNYLQAFSADCSHLSFGTYKSGKTMALSQRKAFGSLMNDLEETLTISNSYTSSMPLNSRDLVYPDEGQLKFDFDTHRATADSRYYNPPKFSQTQLKKIDDATVHGNDYVSHSSISGSIFKNIQQPRSALPVVIDQNARNLSPLPSEAKSYSNSLPNDILATAVQSINARDSPAFLVSHSTSPRHSNSASSNKSPPASMFEVSNPGAFSVSHPSAQALLGAYLATGPVHNEHLLAHSCSQTGYPAVHQGQTYTVSAYEQAYLDGNVFHESLTGIKYNFPHYRGASISSLPLSGSFTGYQSSGSSADIPGSFLDNLSAGPAGSKVDYDDFLRSEYRSGGAKLNGLQQNYGHGSRTISTILDSAYNGLQGQNHLLAGYQQGRQQLQLHGALGYPDTHYSQAGITMEQQQQHQQQLQNIRDMILNGSQGSSSKQPPQFWQQSY